MLDLWKQVMHLDTPRRDCTVEWDDGIDLDALLLTHIKQWYAHQLNNAPTNLLPIEDLAAQIPLDTRDGIVIATVPEQSVRPMEWKLAEWQHSNLKVGASAESILSNIGDILINSEINDVLVVLKCRIVDGYYIEVVNH